jgi:hypothetical protein
VNRPTLHPLVLAFLSVLVSSSGAAQAAATISVRISVADLGGAPVEGADVSIMRNLHDVVAGGQTNPGGVWAGPVPRVGEGLRVVVRGVGYRHADQFFQPGDRDSIVLAVRLAVDLVSLEPVKVTAAETDVRLKSYFINADEIENSNRPIVDGLDVVQKLRPDMIFGRQGMPDLLDQHVGPGGWARRHFAGAMVDKWHQYGYCGPIQEIFVNGTLVRAVMMDPAPRMKLTGPGLFIHRRAATILASIKPEHIAEMSYTECTESTPGIPIRGSNAIYVVLKDGIAYTPSNGSFVTEPHSPAKLDVRRSRLLGVFDESGEPLEGAEVIDDPGGMKALTTSTGTITLAYLPVGDATLRISKAGFLATTLPVMFSASDSTAITVILSRTPRPPDSSASTRPQHLQHLD